MDPKPLEETDPWLAEHILKIVNGIHPNLKAIDFQKERSALMLKNGMWKLTKERGRNEPCYCGSGRKFKVCCKDKKYPLICRFCNKEVICKKDPNDLKTCRCYDPKPKEAQS